MKTYYFEVSKNAETLIEESFEWYSKNSVTAAFNFIEEINLSFEKIHHNPFRYSIKLGNIREAKLSVFPFCIIYEVDDLKKVIHIH